MKKLILFSLCLATILNIHLEAFSNRFAYDERPEAYGVRTSCAYNQCLNCAKYDIEKENNGDIKNIANYAAMFTKNLEHDSTTGIATESGQQNFEILVQATKDGQQSTYNSITRHAGAGKFVNPQASAAWSLIGRDNSLTPVALPPTLDSEWAGADIAEVLLQAICRSVSFSDYGTGTGTDVDPINGGSITQNACRVLNAFGASYHGPRDGGIVTPAVLFRGNAPACAVGPYGSQFIWQNLHRLNLANAIVKQYVPIASNKEFGVTWQHFVDLQNGLTPVPYGPGDFSGERYSINGRDIATSVHNDLAVDFPLQAFNIVLNNNFPWAPNLPYYNGDMPNEKPFATMGPQDVATLIGGISVQALKNAWAHKWRASLRLRPEAMAGLIHQVVVSEENPYGLNNTIFGTLNGINFMQWIKSYNLTQTPYNAANGTYLLAQMYPEGCPAHPAYPAGHATFVSAGVTIIKALIDDTALFKDYLTPVVPDPNDPTQLVPLSDGSENLLTVGGELDKLAANIAMARDFAGVHYRADGDNGILLGESVAIQFLMDWAATYAEETFAGFELTKMDGIRIRITANGVTVI